MQIGQTFSDKKEKTEGIRRTFISIIRLYKIQQGINSNIREFRIVVRTRILKPFYPGLQKKLQSGIYSFTFLGFFFPEVSSYFVEPLQAAQFVYHNISWVVRDGLTFQVDRA